MDPVVLLGLSCAVFVGSHLVLSHPPVRQPLIARVGLGRFRLGYSIVSVVTWLPVVAVFWTHRHAGATLWVLRTPPFVHGAELVAACGVAMLVAGFVQPAPSSMESHVKGDHLAVRGMNHVTRHPVMWGTTLLASAHLIANGWASDVVFWGSHAFLGLAGAVHQDRRMLATRAGYADFASRTSFVPNPLGLARIGSRSAFAVLAGLALAAGVRFAHHWF